MALSPAGKPVTSGAAALMSTARSSHTLSMYFRKALGERVNSNTRSKSGWCFFINSRAEGLSMSSNGWIWTWQSVIKELACDREAIEASGHAALHGPAAMSAEVKYRSGVGRIVPIG